MTTDTMKGESTEFCVCPHHLSTMLMHLNPNPNPNPTWFNSNTDFFRSQYRWRYDAVTASTMSSVLGFELQSRDALRRVNNKGKDIFVLPYNGLPMIQLNMHQIVNDADVRDAYPSESLYRWQVIQHCVGSTQIIN